MHEYRGPVRACLERLPQEPCTVLLGGNERLVVVSAAFSVPPQPPLLFQVAHDCHHGGVGNVPIPLEVTQHIAHRHRLTPGPDPAHHLDFQVTECWHDTSRHQATIRIVDRISGLAAPGCLRPNYAVSTM